MDKNTKETLKRLVEQIERLGEEQAALGADIRDKFTEGKNQGFDVKILRRIIRERKKPKEKRDEEDMVYDTYMSALEGTPMGEYLAKQDKREVAHA